MQPKFWLFTSRVLWHCVRLYTEGNPIIGLEYVNQGFYKFQWLDFDGRVNSSVQQCLFISLPLALIYLILLDIK